MFCFLASHWHYQKKISIYWQQKKYDITIKCTICNGKFLKAICGWSALTKHIDTNKQKTWFVAAALSSKVTTLKLIVLNHVNHVI